MNMVQVHLSAKHYFPGDILKGRASWQLPETPKSIDLNLIWHTSGRGTEDVEVVESQSVATLNSSGEYSFQFTLPMSPYSFHGKLISLIWAVEIVISSPHESALEEFVLSPSREPVRLAEGGAGEWQ